MANPFWNFWQGPGWVPDWMKEKLFLEGNPNGGSLGGPSTATQSIPQDIMQNEFPQALNTADGGVAAGIIGSLLERKLGGSVKPDDSIADFFERQAGEQRFDKSIGESVKKEDDSVEKALEKGFLDEDEDPFNTNQLFLASILKGLKKDFKAMPARGQGTYIPRPDLPSMTKDWESNKTYWNIG